MNHVALFAGMGGFIYAAKQAGFETIWANEYDEKCCDFLEENFPSISVNRKSIAELDERDISSIKDSVDLLSAGFPCQSFSQAGGAFKAFDDPRGQLFFDIPRIIGLMKEPPKVVLLENVPNMKVFDNGALLKTVLTEMRFAGYWVKQSHAEILSSAEFGATPQRRERLFIVCAHKSYFDSNPFRFDKIKKRDRPPLTDVLDLSEKLADHYYLSPDSKYYKMIDELAETHGKGRLFQIRRVVARAVPEGLCPTLTANMGDGGHNVPFVYDGHGLRRLSEEECLRMQGFEPEKITVPDHILPKHLLKMVGNAVSVKTAQAIIEQIKTQLLTNDRGVDEEHDSVAFSVK
jgi:DNA (cytosine-5)-methyltransferase 1